MSAGVSATRQARRVSGADYVAPTSLPLGRDSVTYEVMFMGFLGSSRALLLQTTHPLVAAGVAEHSDYARDPWTRLYRTFDAVTKLIYGDPEVSRRQTTRMEKRHTPVVGTAADGRGYDARDRELGLWVWATLTETALYAYERVHGRLHPVDRARYYEEQKLFAVGCSVPLELVPETVEDFEAYVARIVDTELEATEAGRDIAHFTFEPPMPGVIGRPIGAVNRWTAAALFPPRVRQMYDLPWDERRERRYRRFLRVVAVSDRALPSAMTRGLFLRLVVDHDLLMRLERMSVQRRAARKRGQRASDAAR